MKLAETILLIGQKEKEVSEWYSRRAGNLYKSYRKDNGEVVKEPDYDVNECTKVIADLQRQVRELRQLITVANGTTPVEWLVGEGEAARKISIAEAIVLIKQMRGEQVACEKLAEAKTHSRVNDLGGSRRSIYDRGATDDKFKFEEVFEVTYDTKIYRDEADKLKRQINKLEAAIQQANWNTDIAWEE